MNRRAIEKRLTETAAAVRVAEAERAEAVAARDEAIRAARDAGVPWVTIQSLTGLPPDSIRRSLARTEN